MENFRIIPVGALAVNCYLVFLEKSRLLLIVDPGDDADLIISAAKSFAYEKAAIILTHAHVDHIGAVPEINKALNCSFVYLGSGDNELYNSPDNHILPYLPPVADLPRTTAVWDVPGVKLLLTPGHSKGSICLLGDGFMVTGDTIFAEGFGRYDLHGGNAAILKQTLSGLKNFDENLTIYPGHGESEKLGRALRNISYFVN